MSTWDPAEPVIELQNIHVIHKSRTGTMFKRDTVHAVNDVSLQVRKGHTLGIVGESGCGKSTTARVMVGLQEATSGTVLFKGKPVARGAKAQKEMGMSVSMVFQDASTALNASHARDHWRLSVVPSGTMLPPAT